MMSTGTWVKVTQSGNANGTRMLHTDTQGRPVVRFDKQWWLVEKTSGVLGQSKECRVVGKA